jgi:hypothetical protein
MSSAVLQNLFGWFYRPHGEKSLAKKLNKMFSIISIGAQLHSGEEKKGGQLFYNLKAF